MKNILNYIRRCAWCGLGSGQKLGLCPNCEQYWESRCIDETLMMSLYDFPVHRLFISKDHMSKERELAVLLKGDHHSRLWRYYAELFLKQRLISNASLPVNPTIISAPSSTNRKHAQLFAQALSELTGWEHESYFEDAGTAQKTLSKKQRLQRHLKPLTNMGRWSSVVFIDDMIVTGGTAKAAYESIDAENFEVWTLMHQLLLH